MCMDFRLLPALQDERQRQQCLEMHRRVEFESEEVAGHWVSCLPLLAASWIDEAGVIEFYSKQRLADESQDIVARLLHVYRNMVSLFSISERDALTGLLNRKSFDDTFYKLSKKVALLDVDKPLMGARAGHGLIPMRRIEPGQRFWLAMVDIDHFKRVNGNFGHQIGDEILILVARSLKN
jgi:GGDEF domain-containing protein